MEMCGQLHALAAWPPGKESPVQEAGWAPEPDWKCCGKEKNLLPQTEFGPPRTLVTILTAQLGRYYYYYYLAGCTMFPHIPAPI